MGSLSELKKFGDCVTLDTLISRGEMAEGIEKEQDAVFMLDRHTDTMCTVPVRTKAAKLAYNALRDFRGSTYLNRVHTDGSSELKQAVEWFGFHHTTSTPGRPQRNGVIENRVWFVKRHGSANAKQAGLPAKARSWSVPYFCDAMTFLIDENGESP